MSTTELPCDLAGLGVLVTRPAHQAVGLCRLIAQCGGRPLVFPALEIAPPRAPEAARRLLQREWDLVIYTSPNAVQFTRSLSPTGRLPAASRVAAVGGGSARALAEAGLQPDLVPERFDSEGLLALPDLAQVAGRRILIVRGEGGRPLLGDTLAERGAEVNYAEVYRRARPEADAAPLLARWGRDVQAVTATSVEVLENLDSLLGGQGRGLLRDTPLLVISERMVEAAERLGFTRVLLATGAGDEAILNALCGLLEN